MSFVLSRLGRQPCIMPQTGAGGQGPGARERKEGTELGTWVPLFPGPSFPSLAPGPWSPAPGPYV